MWRDRTLHRRREDLDDLDPRLLQLFAEDEHHVVKGSLAGTVIRASGDWDKSQPGRNARMDQQTVSSFCIGILDVTRLGWIPLLWLAKRAERLW